AANCLGEVGDATVGDELVRIFDELTWNLEEEGQEDEEDEEIQEEDERALRDDGKTPKLAVAVACAELGRKGPLRKRVKYLEALLRRYFYGSPLERRTLAMAYARLGEFQKAAAQYEACLQETPRDGVLWYNLACALSRAGEAYKALKALRRAVASGYGADPSQISWAHRDRDLEPVRKLRGFEELFGKGAVEEPGAEKSGTR
ncbi:MAG: tetratricopeptide repeat protein, partial [Planctomycetota bacterium]